MLKKSLMKPHFFLAAFIIALLTVNLIIPVIPNPGAVCSLLVAYASFSKGLRAGLIVSAIAVLYSFSFHLIYPHLDDGMLRAFLDLLTLPSLSLMIGHLKEESLKVSRIQSQILTSEQKAAIAQEEVVVRTKELEIARDSLNLLIEAIPQMVWKCRPDGYTEFYNKRWYEYTGKNDLSGWDWVNVIHPEDRDRTLKVWNESVKNSTVYEVEYRFRRHDGKYLWFLGRALPMKDSILWFGTCTNIDDQKQYQEKLYNLVQTKDGLITSLSYELKTPLTGILGWIEIIQSGNIGELRTKQILSIIEKNSRSLCKTIDNLLDVSKMIQGKISLNLYPLDLSSIINQCVESVKTSVIAKNINLSVEARRSSFLVHGDSERLQQVIWNLLSNAIKFTSYGGSVSTSLSYAEKQEVASITILDSGVGIKSDILPFIFDRFRSSSGGLGLGLAIARHIVEMHGGTIEACSEGEGMGAIFVVKLPLLRLTNYHHK